MIILYIIRLQQQQLSSGSLRQQIINGRIVITNITLAMLIKVTAILLGIAGITTIWQAVIADVGVTIVAVINSLRCLNIKD